MIRFTKRFMIPISFKYTVRVLKIEQSILGVKSVSQKIIHLATKFGHVERSVPTNERAGRSTTTTPRGTTGSTSITPRPTCSRTARPMATSCGGESNSSILIKEFFRVHSKYLKFLSLQICICFLFLSLCLSVL